MSLQEAFRTRTVGDTPMPDGYGERTDDGGERLPSDEGGKLTLGRYRLEKALGKGAMGVVYLGKDLASGRLAAIKTMALPRDSEAGGLEQMRRQFFREAETAGRLSHPNIVAVYDAGEERGLAYIAMEFLRGHDLARHAGPADRLPLPQVLSIAARVADALGYAHGRGVVHGDIKPANIMYERESDTAKVTDFGIARTAVSGRTGEVQGTPSFMSPEQAAGRKVDGRSDLYSLGVSLYQLACGRLPFRAESLAELLFKIAGEPPPPIRDIDPQLPPCLAALIDTALAKDPARRFQSGEEMAQAIRECMATP